MTTSDIEVRVAGVSFRPGYPDNLHRLHAVLEQRQVDALGWDKSPHDDSPVPWPDMPTALPATLRRDPDNEHDANAIEIHVAALGRGPGAFIGFVPAHVAERLAPSLDRGDEWRATVSKVMIDPDHEDRPGAVLNLACVTRARQGV